MPERQKSGLYLLSASQITTFEECQRKWAFRAIDKVEVAQGESAQLGSRTHRILEKYLQGEGWDFSPDNAEVSKIARSGIEFLPQPKEAGLELEKHFRLRTDVAEYQGYIDFLLPPSTFGFTQEEADHIPAVVGDHKTTSHLRWAKSSEELRKDVQANLYAHYAFTRWPLEQEVELRWIYYQTKGTHKAKRTHLRITPSEVSTTMQNIDATALRIGQILDTVNVSSRTGRTHEALELPPTPEACEKYGGCPYRHICKLSPMARAQAVMVKQAEDFTRDGLAAKEVEEGMTAVDFNSIMARLQAQNSATQDAVAHMSKEAERISESKFPALTIVPPAINPPETQPPPSAADLKASEEGKKTRGGKKPPKSEGFTLFIDCMPVGEKYTPFEKLVSSANALIKQAKGVDDYRMISYTSGGDLTLALEDVVKTEAPEAIVICSRTAEAQVVMNRLTALARSVVRAF